MTKGLVYYTDNGVDKQIGQAVRDQILAAAPGLPIACVALIGRQGGLPKWHGYNDAREYHGVGWPLERGYLTMFQQQLAALEMLSADVAFMVEHDVLYSPSHFDFTPADAGTFYYNQHTWRVNAETGQAVFYYCNQVSGLCASRALLVEHYRKVVAHVEQHGFERSIGFEPGTNRRQRALFGEHPVETWMSAGCNVDIKSGSCLTKWRSSPAQFRNKDTCRGWTEADAIPGWGVTKGRFAAFLEDLEKGSHAVSA